MITPEEIEKLAELARIDIKESERAELSKDIEEIIAYVEKVSKVAGGGEVGKRDERTVLREDGNPHEKGEFTEELVKQFPKRDGNYLEVKKIITQD